MAVWLRTVAVRLAPLSGRPANVVTVAPWLGVKPTLLCTNTLYSYVVNLKGRFLKSPYKFLFCGKQNTHISFSLQNTGFPFLIPLKCTIFCFSLQKRIIFFFLPTQKTFHYFCSSGVFTKVSGKIFY